MVKLILMHMFILLDERRLCTRRSAINLAPPTIWSVKFNLVGKGSGHPYYSQIRWRCKVQTGISVLRILPPSPQGEHLQHKSPMATPTQRMQLHYAHALPPLLLDIDWALKDKPGNGLHPLMISSYGMKCSYLWSLPFV